MKFINQTNVEHLVIALVHQIVIALIFGNWWTGMAFGAALYVGREFCQAEMRIIQANGWGTYKNAHKLGHYPELMAFNFKKWWDLDAIMDMVLPYAGTVALAMIMQGFN